MGYALPGPRIGWCSVPDVLAIDSQSSRGILERECGGMESSIAVRSLADRQLLATIASYELVAGATSVRARPDRGSEVGGTIQIELSPRSGKLLEFYFPITQPPRSGEIVMKGFIQTADGERRSFECRTPVTQRDHE